LYSVPHVPDTYVRGPHFYFCLRCTICFSYHVYSSAPELLEPVLRPRTALYCGDELI
ncbi:unnamed protein product, partial [Laminaria digitata]